MLLGHLPQRDLLTILIPPYQVLNSYTLINQLLQHLLLTLYYFSLVLQLLAEGALLQLVVNPVLGIVRYLDILITKDGFLFLPQNIRGDQHVEGVIHPTLYVLLLLAGESGAIGFLLQLIVYHVDQLLCHFSVGGDPFFVDDITDL